MKILLKVGGAIGVLLAIGGCDAGPPPSTFTDEMAKFAAQFPNAKASAYQDAILHVSNAKRFDKIDDCYSRSADAITLVLLIDKAGQVSGVSTDLDNPRAACFRKSYLKAAFPAPPFAPFRQALSMETEPGASNYHSDPSDGGGGGPSMPGAPPKCSSKVGCGL